MKAYLPLLLLLTFTMNAPAATEVMLPDLATSSSGEVSFHRTIIPGNSNGIDEIISALLQFGGEPADKNLYGPFFPRTLERSSAWSGAEPLWRYYLGTRVKNNRVVVSFETEANRYLNNTVFIQRLVKRAIEATIRLHFPDTTCIDYEIDGTIVTDWDG